MWILGDATLYNTEKVDFEELLLKTILTLSVNLLLYHTQQC